METSFVRYPEPPPLHYCGGSVQFKNHYTATRNIALGESGQIKTTLFSHAKRVFNSGVLEQRNGMPQFIYKASKLPMKIDPRAKFIPTNGDVMRVVGTEEDSGLSWDSHVQIDPNGSLQDNGKIGDSNVAQIPLNAPRTPMSSMYGTPLIRSPLYSINPGAPYTRFQSRSEGSTPTNINQRPPGQSPPGDTSSPSEGDIGGNTGMDTLSSLHSYEGYNNSLARRIFSWPAGTREQTISTTSSDNSLNSPSSANSLYNRAPILNHQVGRSYEPPSSADSSVNTVSTSPSSPPSNDRGLIWNIGNQVTVPLLTVNPVMPRPPVPLYPTIHQYPPLQISSSERMGPLQISPPENLPSANLHLAVIQNQMVRDETLQIARQMGNSVLSTAANVARTSAQAAARVTRMITGAGFNSLRDAYASFRSHQTTDVSLRSSGAYTMPGTWTNDSDNESEPRLTQMFSQWLNNLMTSRTGHPTIQEPPRIGPSQETRYIEDQAGPSRKLLQFANRAVTQRNTQQNALTRYAAKKDPIVPSNETRYIEAGPASARPLQIVTRGNTKRNVKKENNAKLKTLKGKGPDQKLLHLNRNAALQDKTRNLVKEGKLSPNASTISSMTGSSSSNEGPSVRRTRSPKK